MLNIQEETDIKEIELVEEDYRMLHGKYQYREPAKKNGYDVEVHEYVAPTGVGYQIILRKEDANSKHIRSKGYGVEAQPRTFDWHQLRGLNA